MVKKNKQFVEGLIDECAGAKCSCSCCDDEMVQEWIVEYFKFHERLKDHLKKHWIKIKFIKDRVEFKNCSDGKKCKFLKYSLNKDIDPRPIDCKIYPFSVDWHNIDFDKKIVNLYLRWMECPIIKMRASLEKFKKQVEYIIKRDFATLFEWLDFQVKFIEKDNKLLRIISKF